MNTGAATEARILDLPLDSLLLIFNGVSESDRRIVLPLICREWSAACREPGTLWSHVSVHDEQLHRAANIRFSLLRAWLLHRARSISSLEIRFGRHQHDMQGGSLASFLPSMAAAGTLAKLTLQLPTLKLQPRDFAALGHITSLVDLQLEAGCRAGLLVGGLQALGDLSQLQSLDLHMHLGGCAGIRDFPRRILQLTQLRRLHLCIPNIDFLALPHEVTQLRNLVDLAMEGCFLLPDLIAMREPLPAGFGLLPLTRLCLAPYAFGAELDRHGFAGDPLEEIRGLTRLRDLTFSQCQVHPGAFEGGQNPVEALASLSQLTELNLRGSPVFAQHLPRWMVLDNLVSADLTCCDLQKIPASLCAASSLVSLTLARNRVDRMPAAAQVDWNSIEKLEMRHNYLERAPVFFAPNLRIISFRSNGPLFQFRDEDVSMFLDRWPALEVLDVDRGKTDDLGPGPGRLPPPRWTYKSLCILFQALASVVNIRDVSIILHRGPVREHEVVLQNSDVLENGLIISAERAYDRRFG